MPQTASPTGCNAFSSDPNRLAPEYSEADISPAFRPNGSTDPQDEDYLNLVDKHFADWRLKVHGLVARVIVAVA